MPVLLIVLLIYRSSIESTSRRKSPFAAAPRRLLAYRLQQYRKPQAAIKPCLPEQAYAPTV